ncbi:MULTISPECIES: TetR/AcrR family transcriptional regulator [Streptomyces]|uniref:DNA-binding transcriptional regulator, AcrR family n=1 Tax=Streptomyces melanosporofaciens TaxID=67327 RepID=A0A1H4I942_STRMJ|nr:TetR/AcrR family transcriptional regulator [Streptomyces melanosporofaciens]SEB30577.1 DNA-binding transcriptional regulator, AcrR family [Streptomyces melanosporofaciens]
MSSQKWSAPRRRNPRGQGQVLKAQLVEAAAKLLATLDQPETLTLRQVAREVGVAPASIYSHFPDLSALIQHVLRLRYEELARLMDEAAQPAASPLADLVARCAAYVHWGVDQRGHYRTLFGGRMPSDLVPGTAHGAGAELLGAVVASLAAATTGERKRCTADQQWQAGLMLWTALHGLVSLYNDHGTIPWPPLDGLITDLLSLHTGRPAAEIEALLPQGEGASGPAGLRGT